MIRESLSSKLALGDKAPYFSLPGTDGKLYSMKDFDAAKAFAVLFTCNHCPYVQAWDERLIELQKNYQESGFQLVAICSNDPKSYPEDSFENMKKKSESMDFVYPYLQDESQEVAKEYDAACTPEVFLFDENKELSYQGRVDDNHGDISLVSSNCLEDALKAVLSGKKPETPLTHALGCSIKWKG